MIGIIILISFIMVCYGISNMVIYSNGPFHMFTNFREYITRKSEKLGELFTCMMCFPFWVGVIVSLINIVFFPTLMLTPFMIVMSYGGLTALKIIAILFFDGCFSFWTTWNNQKIEE